MMSWNHPLDNTIEFHEPMLNPNNLDLAWREHADRQKFAFYQVKVRLFYLHYS